MSCLPFATVDLPEFASPNNNPQWCGGSYVLSMAEGTPDMRFPTKEWSAEWRCGCWRSLEEIVGMRRPQGLPSRRRRRTQSKVKSWL